MGIKTDRLINGIKLKTQKYIHPPMKKPIFGKEDKIIQWKKESISTNSAGLSECLHVEECK